MLIQSVQYTFAPADVDKAAALFRELREVSRKEPGIVHFDVARSKERPNVFALWEVYRDEAALKAHMESEHFNRLGINGIRRLAQQRVGDLLIALE